MVTLNGTIRQSRIDIPFSVPIEAGKVEHYTLRFSVYAMAALMDHYQLTTLEDVGKKLASIKTIDDMIVAIWAGLQTHHRGLTIDDAASILDALGVFELQGILAKALNAANPERAAAMEEEMSKVSDSPPKPPLSTGS
jgi:hypothetical protein